MFLLCMAGAALAQQEEKTLLEPVIARQMAGRAGTVVVVDVESGRVLARHNAKMAAQRVTAPGSAVKPLVLMELLQSGKLDPQQRVFCRRALTIAGRRMDCSHPEAINSLDAPDAIAYSCNTYFATMAARLTPLELKHVYERAGFTAPTHFVTAEATGRVALAPDTPELQLQALGDWGVEITPLELLAAYRTLALAKLKGDAPAAAAPVFDGLERSVKYGMAHAAQPAGITAAGKTGTAGNSGSAQTHGFFAGYAPADKPEIALVVYLEQGRGSDAAAVAGAIFTAYASAKRAGR
ncbi:MAG TPA: penicillin-binding transpeptidase domain-containing protein [Candidatus Angelobacter sp.]|nr:penicillin-binding transpeptidase domain-containing protein [Candidatus Angelobacter sp.]